MGTYRTARNIESSIIDFLNDSLILGQWDNVIIEKTFKRIYALQMDENKGQAAICVRCSDTNRKRIEIGSDLVTRSEIVLIDVFATSDGQRLDLVDYLGLVLLPGMPYYEYTITNGVVTTKTQTDRIRILTFEDKPVQFGVDKSSLDVQDRYRHIITMNVGLNKVEGI